MILTDRGGFKLTYNLNIFVHYKMLLLSTKITKGHNFTNIAVVERANRYSLLPGNVYSDESLWKSCSY